MPEEMKKTVIEKRLCAKIIPDLCSIETGSLTDEAGWRYVTQYVLVNSVMVGMRQ
jgi:hypothetical protein